MIAELPASRRAVILHRRKPMKTSEASARRRSPLSETTRADQSSRESIKPPANAGGEAPVQKGREVNFGVLSCPNFHALKTDLFELESEPAPLKNKRRKLAAGSVRIHLEFEVGTGSAPPEWLQTWMTNTMKPVGKPASPKGRVTVTDFVSSRLEERPGSRLTLEEAWRSYREHCLRNGSVPMSSNTARCAITREVAERFGLHCSHDIEDEAGRIRRGWRRLALAVSQPSASAVATLRGEKSRVAPLRRLRTGSSTP